jgi:hypothetical protein
MTDYGRGGVLGAATALPATSTLGLVMANHANPMIVAGVFAVSVLSFSIACTYMIRFALNSRK